MHVSAGGVALELDLTVHMKILFAYEKGYVPASLADGVTGEAG